jgi:hypothetical protein
MLKIHAYGLLKAQAEATDKLKEIAIKHGYVQGKWYESCPFSLRLLNHAMSLTG